MTAALRASTGCLKAQAAPSHPTHQHCPLGKPTSHTESPLAGRYEGELARKYSGRFPFELAPHVFAVAEAAYRNLCSMQEDQIDSWVSRAIHDSHATRFRDAGSLTSQTIYLSGGPVHRRQRRVGCW